MFKKSINPITWLLMEAAIEQDARKRTRRLVDDDGFTLHATRQRNNRKRIIASGQKRREHQLRRCRYDDTGVGRVETGHTDRIGVAT